MTEHELLLIPVPALLTAAALGFLLKSGRALAIAADIPNDRSLHSRPTPRIGGLVLLPAALACAAALMPAARGLLLLALALGLLSFADDRRSLPVMVRLAAHLGAAAVAAGLLLAGADGWRVALLALVIAWCANLFNFMDGADGLAGGMALFGFGAYALAAWPQQPGLAAVCGSLAAASAGFLVFNFPPARCFMGDAGSVPLGFLAAVLGLWGVRLDLWPGWFPCLVFLPFLADATITLGRRALSGERVWQAHREHYYQRLVRMGWSHRRLAGAAYALMAGCAAAALALRQASPALLWPALGVCLGGFLALLGCVDRMWRRHRSQS
ncbi:hypothetical protein B9N43_11560 [Denitratisoma sp. DHT3]|uniref:MraY family glycosyltransferase n=1 Tax=Denitratisoma sp. DHT3 TaxID=1981880 RepID=UPI001198C345|nr:glycosyltransferase family 4 protein [Denitratisoma sp. DHT3]QDX81830.1 hypothetical protein B9N43_11560 [Denitratisoma sp. DHT3]